MNNDDDRFSRRAHPAAVAPKRPAHLVLTPTTAPAFLAKFFPGAPLTTWLNKRIMEQILDSLALPPGINAPEAPTGRFIIRIPAGASCQIPSCFDRAILCVEGGTIVGGMAPGLTPEGVKFPVHEDILERNDLFEPGPEAA
jgi:hypothetical protein